MVRTPRFHCCGLGSIPGPGNTILEATWHGQKIIIIILLIFPFIIGSSVS